MLVTFDPGISQRKNSSECGLEEINSFVVDLLLPVEYNFETGQRLRVC